MTVKGTERTCNGDVGASERGDRSLTSHRKEGGFCKPLVISTQFSSKILEQVIRACSGGLDLETARIRS